MNYALCIYLNSFWKLKRGKIFQWQSRKLSPRGDECQKMAVAAVSCGSKAWTTMPLLSFFMCTPRCLFVTVRVYQGNLSVRYFSSDTLAACWHELLQERWMVCYGVGISVLLSEWKSVRKWIVGQVGGHSHWGVTAQERRGTQNTQSSARLVHPFAAQCEERCNLSGFLFLN